MTRVEVSQRGRERIRRGHPWIFRAEVREARGAASGELVEIYSHPLGYLGRALYSTESQIALRMVTTGEETVDDGFWQRRLQSALALREPLVGSTEAYRWVHGESDGMPSLIVDRYGDYLSVQTLSQGMEHLKHSLVRLMVDLVHPRGIVERNDPKVRALEGLAPVKSVLYGEVPRLVHVLDEGLRLQVDLWEGQKTGLFLDQRENHLAAARYAKGEALDVFAYDGGFSLHLARVCEKVLSVDTSGEALARLRSNAEANGLANIETIEANAFDFLRELADRSALFDTIVLDPPAFAKNRAAVAQAERGYKEINLRALKILRPGGHLVTSTCSYHIQESHFLDILSAATADVGARLLVVEKRAQARDHPILLTMPETHYLKCLVLQKQAGAS